MRLTFAGQVGIEVDGVAVDLTPLGRSGRLFWAYLACERHRPVPKDELAEVLWGDDDLPRSWEQMLRGNASKLRASILGAGVGPDVLVSAFGAYQVRLPPGAAVDVEEAEQHVERAFEALATGDADAAATAARGAAAVAALGFLPGWAGIWVERRQAEVREVRLRALEALGQASCARRAWADAVGAAEEAIGIEPFRESAFQVLMAAHRGAGNVGEGLRAYERCRRTLAEELGASPSAATEQVYLSLLAEEATEAGQLPLPVALASVRGRFLVGRKAEVDRLAAAVERAAGGGGRQAVLVGGEPGIGKSALVAEVARLAHAGDADVLYGRCDEELGVAYQPFAEALGRYVAHCTPAALRAHAGAHGGELTRIAPQLGQRLPEAPAPRVTGSEGDRYRLFEAVAALLEQAAGDRLVVLVLDDLQWAAPQTLALLRHVLRPSPVPLVVLGTYRHTEVGPSHPFTATLADLWREPGVERVLLDGLDEEAVRAFVEQSRAHAPDSADESLARALHARTRGNPFFVGEFLRHLAESGAVYRRDGPWSYYDDAEGLGVPEGVRDVVVRRLHRLSTDVNRILTLASVVGLDFELALLEQVEGGTPADTVLDALDEAVAARVVAELEPGRYEFAHALVRDTIYATLTASRRVRLHHRVGDGLAALAGDDASQLPALAHHFAAAAADGAATKAGDYALAAARQAFGQVAWDDALAFAHLGLGVLSRPDPGQLERRFDLLLIVVEVEMVLVRIPRAVAAAKEAAEVAHLLGSHERLARAVSLYLLSEGSADPRAIELAEEAARGLGDSEPALRARVLAGLAVSRPRRAAGRWDEDTEAALALARRSGDADAVHAALVARRTFLCETPRAQEWLDVEEELAALGPPTAPVAGTRWIHGVGRARANARLALGDRAGFEAVVLDVERWYTELRNTGLGAQLAIWRGSVALLDGRFAEVPDCAAELLRLAPGHTDVRAVQLARMALDQGQPEQAKARVLDDLTAWPRHNILLAMAACMHAELGEAEEARRIFDELAADDFARVFLGLTSTTFVYLAEAVTALGDYQLAASLYARFAPYGGIAAISGVGVAHVPGAIDRYLGQLATVLGRWDDAPRHFEAALVIEDGLRSPTLLARTRYRYGRMLLERGGPGDEDRARGLLRAAATTAGELGMTRLAEQAAVRV